MTNHEINAHMAQGIPIRADTKQDKMHRALMVIVLSPNIRAWLAENDPKALQQCREALDLDNIIARLCTREEADEFAALWAPDTE